MSKSKLSIIMAEYNTEEVHLCQAIESILNQTYGNFEFIIVDDGGKNDMEAIARTFNDNRVRIVKNLHNRGLVYSLNKAIEAASTKYLVRMDTDDVAERDRLERQVEFMDNHPEYSVVGTRAYEISNGHNLGILGKSGEKTKRQIMRGDTMIHPSVIMRKDVILNVGGYPNYKRAEDLGLWCELLLAGSRFYVMEDVLLKYRVDPEDYKKRTLKTRGGELRARIHYYPRLKAGPIEYLRIAKSIFAGIIPGGLMRWYRKGVLSGSKDK